MFNIDALAGLSKTEAIVKNLISFSKLSSILNLTPSSSVLSSLTMGFRKTLKGGFEYPTEIPLKYFNLLF
jgi:hypothetical protein